MANNDRDDLYYGETPQRASRQSDAKHQDDQNQGRRQSGQNRAGRYSVQANSAELRESYNDNEESYRDTQDFRINQSRTASENSRNPDNRTSYSEQGDERNSIRTKSHPQSMMSNYAYARERRVAPKELDLTSVLLQDTVNIRYGL